MTFWREDGKLQAQGPACDGSRRGRWKFWWSEGQLSDEGEYRGGLREGVWHAWSEDGKRSYEVAYERNVKVSKLMPEAANGDEAKFCEVTFSSWRKSTEVSGWYLVLPEPSLLSPLPIVPSVVSNCSRLALEWGFAICASISDGVAL